MSSFKSQSEYLQSLGLNLYTYRVLRNESIEVAATAINIKPSLLVKIENGHHPNCKLEIIVRLCEHYKISPKAPFTSN